MDFKYAKLRGRIIEKFGTQGNFAEALGMTKQGLSLKMTGKTSFSQKDILKWCDLLSIDLNQVSEFFYA